MKRARDAHGQVDFRSSIASPIGEVTLAAFGMRQSKAMNGWRVYGQYALVLVLDGQGFYEDANGVRQDLAPGDLIQVFPRLRHHYGCVEGTEWITSYLCFRGPVFDLWTRAGLLDPRRPVRRLAPVDGWSRRLEAVLAVPRSGGIAPPLADICRLQSLLADIVSSPSSSPAAEAEQRWLERARGLIEAELGAQPDWDDLARRLGLAAESFRKKFARLEGRPPAAYRMSRLIERAQILIREQRLNDRQISIALGFCDEFYFSRRFKQLTGASPRAFRCGK